MENRFKVTAKRLDNHVCMIEVLDLKTRMVYTRFCNSHPEGLVDCVKWFMKEINNANEV